MAVMDTNPLGPRPRRRTAFLVIGNWGAVRLAWAALRVRSIGKGAFGEPAEEYRGRCLGW